MLTPKSVWAQRHCGHVCERSPKSECHLARKAAGFPQHENADLIDLFDDAVVVAANLLTGLGGLQPLMDVWETAAMLPQGVEENAILLACPHARQFPLSVAVNARVRCFAALAALFASAAADLALGRALWRWCLLCLACKWLLAPARRRVHRAISAAVRRVGLHPLRIPDRWLARSLGVRLLRGRPAWLEVPNRAAGTCTGARLVKEAPSRLLHVRGQAGHAEAHIAAGREQLAARMQTRVAGAPPLGELLRRERRAPAVLRPDARADCEIAHAEPAVITAHAVRPDEAQQRPAVLHRCFVGRAGPW